MIPAKVEQFLKKQNESDFFVSENRAECTEIHDHARAYVENGTKTITLNVDAELLRQAEAMLNAYGWTIEEATVLFFMWCVTCPEKMCAWYKNIKDGEINEKNPHAVQA